ncbi:isochorismatase family protein [Pseudorhodoplanes sp.]|uniref:isochorismatase family protein n=1 Tax=Pseudorhodoplanes sp. TaxID=1934341 RepID=UPI00391BC796
MINQDSEISQGVSQDTIAVYKRQNIGNPSGFGSAPALLIVDFVNGFNDPALFGGGNIAQAIERTKALLAAARQAGIPVVFTRIVYADDGSDASVFTRKMPGLLALTETAPAAQIVDALAPLAGEYIIRKTQPSAFFGTGLVGWLTQKRVDTVLLTGCTTSGCVRASAIDSMSHNFRTIVVTDCVGDRAIAPHNANLFDMGQKYADLMTGDEVAARLQSMPHAKVR